MTQLLKTQTTGCPKCDGAAGWCSYCGEALCSDVERHPANADWEVCTLCGGEGEVPEPVAQVFRRRQASAVVVPEPVAVEDQDIRF